MEHKTIVRFIARKNQALVTAEGKIHFNEDGESEVTEGQLDILQKIFGSELEVFTEEDVRKNKLQELSVKDLREILSEISQSEVDKRLGKDKLIESILKLENELDA